MFLLEPNEKEAFMKVIYSVMMFDRNINDQEHEILNSLSIDIFNLENFQRIDIEKDDKIVDEINKIKSIIPVIYLFNILFELQKYNTKSKRYIKRIETILLRTKMKDEIIKSKLFLFGYKFRNNDISQKNNILLKKISKFVKKLRNTTQLTKGKN